MGPEPDIWWLEPARVLPIVSSFDVITWVQGDCVKRNVPMKPFFPPSFCSVISFAPVGLCVQVLVHMSFLYVCVHAFSSLLAAFYVCVNYRAAQTHAGALASFPTVIGAICFSCVNSLRNVAIHYSRPPSLLWTRAVSQCAKLARGTSWCCKIQCHQYALGFLA